MAVIDHFAPPRFILPALVRSTVSSILVSRRRRRHYVKTIEALDGLSTRQLEDLGINRRDIPEFAHRVVYGEVKRI